MSQEFENLARSFMKELIDAISHAKKEGKKSPDEILSEADRAINYFELAVRYFNIGRRDMSLSSLETAREIVKYLKMED